MLDPVWTVAKLENFGRFWVVGAKNAVIPLELLYLGFESVEVLFQKSVGVAQLVKLCTKQAKISAESEQDCSQLTVTQSLILSQLLLKAPARHICSRIVGFRISTMFALFQIDDLCSRAAISFDKTAPVPNLLGQVGDLLLVRVEQTLQLNDPSALLLVKIACVIDCFFRRIALLICHKRQQD